MAELVQTNLLTPESVAARCPSDREQIYNILDSCVTFEVLGEQKRLNNQIPEIYDFERALQAPILEIMLRGFKVDMYEREKTLRELRETVSRTYDILQRYALAIWDKGLNPNSPKQLQEFFYKSLHLPEIWISDKGNRRLSMNREVLEKLQQHYMAMPIIAAILTIREHTKSIKTLESEVDPDSRMRTSYNIAATETGRLSSSKNAFGTGGNLQNWKERLRRPFVADAGWKLGAIDLEQAESREIGFIIGVIFDDWTYLNAVEAGDLHTYTARLVWPELTWSGDLKRDREIAERGFYRDFTYRDMSKRGGHASTYVGQPFTIARHLKVPVKVIELFQQRFFEAFPGIPRLHRWVSQELQTNHSLETYFGRVRHFFGRPDDDATLREGVAFIGQSPTADRMNTGLLKLWTQHRDRIRLLSQLHDAVYFQYRESDDEVEVMKLALAACSVPVISPSGRIFDVSGEAKVGWNWSKRHDDSKPIDSKKNSWNPDGLVKFKGKPDERKRTGMMEMML